MNSRFNIDEEYIYPDVPNHYPSLSEFMESIDISTDEKINHHISEIKIALPHQLIYPLMTAMLDGIRLNIYIPYFQMELDTYIKSQHMDKWVFNELLRVFLQEYQVDETSQTPEKIAQFKECIHQILLTFPDIPLDATLLPQIIDTECLPITEEIRTTFKKTIDTYSADKDLYLADHDFYQFCNFIFKKDNINIGKMLGKSFNLNHISFSGEMILTHLLLFGDLKPLLAVFLNHGLKITLKNSQEETAFHLFAKSAPPDRFGKCYELLKKRFKLDINQLKNADNQTPCDVFFAKNKFLSKQYLKNFMGQNNSTLDIMTELNAPAQNLQADLIAAIQNLSLDMISDLLNKGADLDQPDSSLGMTPRELAQMLSLNLTPLHISHQSWVTVSTSASQGNLFLQDPVTAKHGPAITTSFSYDSNSTLKLSANPIPKLATMSLLANKPKNEDDSEQEKKELAWQRHKNV